MVAALITDFISERVLFVSGVQEMQTSKRLFSLLMVSCPLEDEGKPLYDVPHR